jgi:hypothetical protein
MLLLNANARSSWKDSIHVRTLYAAHELASWIISAGLASAVVVGLLERVGGALRLRCLTRHGISKLSRRVKQLFLIRNLTSVNVIKYSVQMIRFLLPWLWKVREQLLKLVIGQGNIVDNGFILVVSSCHSVVRDVDIYMRS